MPFWHPLIHLQNGWIAAVFCSASFEITSRYDRSWNLQRLFLCQPWQGAAALSDDLLRAHAAATHILRSIATGKPECLSLVSWAKRPIPPALPILKLRV